MNSIVNILEGFEKLTYRILIWFILIPKTIVKIILNPGFAHDYIKNELKEDGESKFDEYMSPVLLYLAITLLPALAIYLLQQYGTTLISPADNLIIGRAMHFEAKTVFKSNTYVMGHEFEWQIWTCGSLDEQGYCKYDEYLTSEKHNSIDGILTWDYDQGDYAITGNAANVQLIDQFTMQDSYDVQLDIPGDYIVYLYTKNFHPATSGDSVEEYYDQFNVYVPENIEELAQVYGETNQKSGLEKESYVENLQSTETIFMGLAMLFPPLFFALITNIFTRIPISETALKETFYTQCYYFTPIGLGIWAWFYSYNFYTKDLFIAQNLLPIPFWIVIIWFIGVETNEIARERGAKIWKALLILFARLAILVGLVFLFGVFFSDLNSLRIVLIYAYPIIGILLILTAIVLRIKKWLKQTK